MLKKKHKCTNSLMTDFLKLLKVLNVPHVPTTWYKVKELIKRTEQTRDDNQLIQSTLYFCPECEENTSEPNRCTNLSCTSAGNRLIFPHSFMVMNIQKQTEQILRSIDQRDLNLSPSTRSNETGSMSDICDGRVYRNIVCSLRNERQRLFLTLTCNIDGAAVYTSSEQTMWAFTACINELNRPLRYLVENILGRKSFHVMVNVYLSPI